MSSHASPVDAGGLSHAEEHSALRGAPARIAAVSLFVTACLLVLKLTLGLLSGSIAVLSDAVDSGTDLVGGAAALFSIRISRMPEDEEHPFGHGKIEAVSAAVAATVIGLGGGLVTYQAVRRLVEGSPEIHVGIGLIAMSVAAVANVVMALFMRREAKQSHSMALAAEATHLTTNIVQASAIIAGLLLVQVTGKVFFDPLTALALAAYMAWIARGLVVTALGEVMDTTLPPEDLRAIQAALAEHESEIRGYHRLRTRRAGATRHIDMHLLFDASRTVHEVHEVSDHVSDEIHRRLPARQHRRDPRRARGRRGRLDSGQANGRGRRIVTNSKRDAGVTRLPGWRLTEQKCGKSSLRFQAGKELTVRKGGAQSHGPTFTNWWIGPPGRRSVERDGLEGPSVECFGGATEYCDPTNGRQDGQR